ncbi:unnamed protein product [Echinostoma caproni]|uniref:Uncharacterized protein n=1 Tax=Echinostoma caproni TaxID=27848 RepID=A0A3P8H5A5_9TREM|nr:unnamed protein product [Echinostoma caproni]
MSSRLREVLESAPKSTVHDSWLRICGVMDTEARIHQNSALGILEGLVRPWIELIEELAKSRRPLKHQVERATHQLLTLSAGELRTKKKLCAAYRACERTWFGHVQSLRTRAKPIQINGELSSLDDSEISANLTPNVTTEPNRRPLRAYHSFRGGSVDLESTSSASNTLDLANRRAPIRRHCSARSATLPSPSSTLQSSDSSGVLMSKVAPAVNKVRY